MSTVSTFQWLTNFTTIPVFLFTGVLNRPDTGPSLYINKLQKLHTKNKKNKLQYYFTMLVFCFNAKIILVHVHFSLFSSQMPKRMSAT